MANQFTTNYSTQYFIERAIAKHGKNYNYDKVVYITAHNYVVVTCPDHGDFNVKAYAHLNGSGCRSCFEESKLLSKKVFLKRCQKKHNNFYSYEFISFKTLKEKIWITCPVHGRFQQIAGSHIRGNGCFECKKENQCNTTQELIKRLDQIYENGLFDYSLVDYKNLETPITVICVKHGKFETRPDYFLRKYGICKKCNKSNVSLGERRLVKIITNLGLIAEQQVRFQDCKDKKPLPFDIGIVNPDSNKRLGLIEFQGKHHYQESFGTSENLSYIQAHDEIKRKYCKDACIPLLEIPYFKNNLTELVTQFIEEC